TEWDMAMHLPSGGDETVGCIRFDVKYLLVGSADERLCLSTGGMIQVYYPLWPSVGARLMTSYKLPVVAPYAGVEIGVNMYYPYYYIWLGCELEPMEGIALYAEASPVGWILCEHWRSVQFGAQLTF
ncbi:MAG: hypothetical protein JSV98_07610, partial [candidate division WOR-3 bacterium]